MTDPESRRKWEERYGEAEVWSGRVNAHVEQWVHDHPTACDVTAIDLACGEGGDALWLANEGWSVTGVDFAAAAIARAQAEASHRGVHVTWVVADLTDWSAPQRADLVTLSFLHEPRPIREAVWATARDAVADGGTLLITGHAPDVESAPGPPPETRFTANDVVKFLGDPWRIEVREQRRGGKGRHAGHVVTDLIVAAQRRPT